jgi:uncharacterized protein YkwD
MSSQGESNLRQGYGGQVKLASSIVVIAFVITLAPISTPKIQAASISADTLVDLANSSRASVGLKAYSVNDKLNASAKMKAEDMLKSDYFAHNSPSGISPWYWFSKAGYSYSYAGENLAIDFYSASGVHEAWMNSPSHRANILDPNFIEIGVAVAAGEYQGKETTIIVQHFGTPSKDAIHNQVKSSNIQLQNSELKSQSNIAKKPQEILAETKVEILVYPQEKRLTFLDFLFPSLILFRNLV